MPDIALDPETEAFIASEVASGRYDSPAEVVRHALHLLADARSTALDAAFARGLDDLDAGRVREADSVFDELEVRYGAPDPSDPT